MKLDAVDLFLEVVRTGSLSAAARATSVPVSTVSQRIAALEARLGVVLLRRTTRRLVLTDAGAAYHAVAARALAELRACEAELGDAAAGVSGTIRVGSTVALDEVLAPVIAGYLRAYPRVGVELHLSTRKADLIAEGIDVTIRTGRLRDDSALVARSLGTVVLQVVASTRYLTTHPPIRHPRDLDAHGVVSFVGTRGARLLRAGGSESYDVAISSRFAGNQVSSLCHYVTADLGLALVPVAFLSRALDAGLLSVVLPEWRAEGQPIHVVHHKQRVVSKRVRSFVDFLLERFPRARFVD
ncbi:MAG: LysR family transcriptional regulator [Labilithrix sp.]|nr:LysR family transcriptional regulator [Labilithrix sp.]